ncbi:Hypothetical protein NGAL_HAMBI2610_40840 [Neorhizobium galegae bv. orientalis]|nr:Hypothetical protein NGAL_HAMBI2610_40840 [Neorhizobium galegae bv. orientalis]
MTEIRLALNRTETEGRKTLLRPQLGVKQQENGGLVKRL